MKQKKVSFHFFKVFLDKNYIEYMILIKNKKSVEIFFSFSSQHVVFTHRRRRRLQFIFKLDDWIFFIKFFQLIKIVYKCLKGGIFVVVVFFFRCAGYWCQSNTHITQHSHFNIWNLRTIYGTVISFDNKIKKSHFFRVGWKILFGYMILKGESCVSIFDFRVAHADAHQSWLQNSKSGNLGGF